MIGPCREETQIELAYTDARVLGIECPVRISGDYYKSAPVTLVGPAGTLELNEGVIRPWRHIHMTQMQAEAMNVESGDLMRVKINTPMSSVIFDDVMVRYIVSGGDGSLKGKVKDLAVRFMFNIVAPALGIDMPMQVHLDTDEGNACMIQDAHSYDLYRVEESAGSAAKVTHVVHNASNVVRSSRLQVAESEKQQRPGGVRLPY